MTETVEFIFDFGSPNAYLAYKALPPVLERTGAELRIMPCLLGGIFKATGNRPPLVAYGHVTAKVAYTQLEIRRFIEKHSLTDFQFNPNFPVNTLMLMRGAIVAEADGRLEAYVEAGLKHMWEDGLKMDEQDIYAQAMTAAGFDGPALLERIQNPAIKARLAENTQAAVDRGVFGIPSFFIGADLYFGKDRLTEIEERLSV